VTPYSPSLTHSYGIAGRVVTVEVKEGLLKFKVKYVFHNMYGLGLV